MKQLLLGICLATVCMLVSAHDNGDESRLVGVWNGVATTQGGVTVRFNIIIDELLLGKYSGSTSYTGDNGCNGFLTYERRRAGLFELRITISTGGVCKSGRRIALWFDDQEQLRYELIDGDRGILASGNLTLDKSGILSRLN